jgi:hypothetical protein
LFKNPSDENEAEYSNPFDEGEDDAPKTSFNDELSKKRNTLDDKNPEVSNPSNDMDR